MIDVRPVAVPGGWGVEVDGLHAVVAAAPLQVETAGETIERVEVPYASIETLPDGFIGRGEVSVASARIDCADRWRSEHGAVECERFIRVHGTAPLAFGTSLLLTDSATTDWTAVRPFAPGVAYGDAPAVAPLAIAGLPARRAGVTTCLIREDRLTAPLFGVLHRDGTWWSVLHLDPDGATTTADGTTESGGETLVDARFRFASLGGTATEDGLRIGMTFPGTEGELTYSSGGLPLQQLRAWRRRYHPLVDGTTQTYRLAVRSGTASGMPAFISKVWRWAWDRLAPAVPMADLPQAVADTAAVLAGQVVTVAGRTGVPLEADTGPERSPDLDRSAVMGFVGANTDAGSALLRLADELGRPAYRTAGLAILDTFTRLRLDPPEGEGFDTVDGLPTTYREFRGRPAVYTRSLAEGARAVLDAVRWERRHGITHADWSQWAIDVGQWLVGQQRLDGAFPRAWEAGTGAVLDGSPSAGYSAIPFLLDLATETGSADFLSAAVRAGEQTWSAYGTDASYAGGTLDNPDVVDKEAAILSAEAFLDLHVAARDHRWLDRATAAATAAETWIYIWDVPMPVDADVTSIHWKPGVPTTGHQLIASGVSMTDGFLAVNASAFARLHAATGDPHWLEVARVVTHGAIAMLARSDRPFDLRGPGWQQEHWSFSPRRGYGLNRRWLVWVPVAHIRGYHRLIDTVPELAVELGLGQVP